MQDGEKLNWDALSPRARQVLKKISKKFGNPRNKFAKKMLDKYLSTNTTITLLNKLSNGQNFLDRVKQGGKPLLIANHKKNNDSEARVSPNKQEQLAQKMVNKENLDLDPSKTDWSKHHERQKFCKKFNQQAQDIELNATFTRNFYRLTKQGQKIVVQNQN